MNAFAIAPSKLFDYTRAGKKPTISGIPALDFKKGDGLVPAIAQDAKTGEVLMLAYMDETAWRNTLETGQAHYYSRSRKRLWRKGEESGNTQEVVSAEVDCDNDTVLLRVKQTGGVACHTGTRSCFTGREVTVPGGSDA